MYGVNAYGVNPYGINPPATVVGGAVFASAFSCSSAVTANLKIDIKLASSLSAVSQLTANLTKPAVILESDLIAVSTLTAALRKGVLLESALTNATTMTSDLVKPASGLGSSLIAQTSMTAALKTGVLFQANFQSLASLTGTMNTPLAVLQADLLTSSTVTANLNVYKFLGASLSASSTLQADLFVNKSLGASLTANSTLTAGLKTGVRFASSLFSQSSLTGALSVSGNVTLSSALISRTSLTGSLQTPILLASALKSQSAFEGDLQADGSGQWGPPSVVFNEPLPIREISLTFDQQGRPLIFYRVDNDTLKLYWYDANLSQNVLLTIGQGITPVACFDYIQNVSYNQSDALIAYARGNSVYWRVFRESFAIERLVRTFSTPVYLESFGLIEGNRIQLAVRTEGACDIPLSDGIITDVAAVNVALTELSFQETFTPIDPNPEPDPGPDIPPTDPPIVVPPTDRQGYWTRKTASGGWISGGTLFNQNPGFRTSIKIKKEYKSYGSSFFIAGGGYAIKSPTNQYYSLTFAVYEDKGELYVHYRGMIQKAPRMWQGDIVPKHKVQVEIRKNLGATLVYWKELADGSGYEAPITYNFPLPFTDPNNPPFATWAYEKTGFGGLPQHFQSINVTSDTVFVDFTHESEDGFGQWVNKFEAPLTQWNVSYQSGFYNVPYKPEYWISITEA